MSRKFLFILFCSLGLTGFGQLSMDSMYIYYGMTQTEPTAPLQDYVLNLEKSGAKLQKVKKDDFDKVISTFSKTKPKKYKSEKHKGTIYFVEIYSGGKKYSGAFDSSMEIGKFINLSTRQIWTIEDSGLIDKLYYALLQIH